MYLESRHHGSNAATNTYPRRRRDDMAMDRGRWEDLNMFVSRIIQLWKPKGSADRILLKNSSLSTSCGLPCIILKVDPIHDNGEAKEQ